MNKLQLLTDRICELVPDIKELRFGCRIIDGIRGNGIIVGVEAMYPETDSYLQIYEATPKRVELSPLGLWKIIGRDITLADVLLALKKSDEDYPIHIDFFFDDGDSVTITQAKGHPIINKKGTWNLTKNALHEQDEETIDFLYSIICK